jgi:hypothetical protein
MNKQAVLSFIGHYIFIVNNNLCMYIATKIQKLTKYSI